MAWGEALRAGLAIAIGLLLGSVLPADLLARARGVDIRARGDGNPGAVNAVRILGWAPGLVTLAYDASVGILAIWIAGLLGASTGISYAAGLASIVGHRFPVFTRFRGGGQGMAASAGLLVYGVAVGLENGWLSPVAVGLLAILVSGAFAWTRSGPVAAVVMLPVLVLEVAIASAGWQFVMFMTVVAAHIWIVQFGAAKNEHRARPVREARDHARG